MSENGLYSVFKYLNTEISATNEVWRRVYRTCKAHVAATYPSSYHVLQVTLIPGDGVGAEITDSVKEIFEYVNAPIEWEQYNVSGMSSEGEVLFKQAMESLRRNRVGLKGASFSYIC